MTDGMTGSKAPALHGRATGVAVTCGSTYHGQTHEVSTTQTRSSIATYRDFQVESLTQLA